MKKVILGMSGGVDSSAAAIILKEQGYEVIGVTLKMLDSFDDTDAIKVCEVLNIKHKTINIVNEFKKEVIDEFINNYKKGYTPNPCVICNKEIKLKYLYNEMLNENADFIATGHYAKNIDGSIYLSKDLNKDQTYFLSKVDKKILERLLLPLDGLCKDEVREIASKYNLLNANKKDSYDICFIKDDIKVFLSNYIKNENGKVIDIDTKKVLGKHNGLTNYTIGQRKGLNIGGTKDRLFVVGKDMINNILYVSEGSSNDYLISNSCIIEDINILEDIQDKTYLAKFRYKSDFIEVKIEKDNNELILNYKEAKSVTPGQTCAIYDNDKLVAGGIIKEVHKDCNKLWYLL